MEQKQKPVAEGEDSSGSGLAFKSIQRPDISGGSETEEVSGTPSSEELLNQLMAMLGSGGGSALDLANAARFDNIAASSRSGLSDDFEFGSCVC